MTALTPTELTTLIAEARNNWYAVGEEGRMIHRLADALESLSATTPTEWEWGIRVSKHEVVGGYNSEDSARSELDFEPRGTLVHRTPAGPWIATETETT